MLIRWIVVALAAALALVGARIGVPGIDRELLGAWDVGTIWPILGTPWWLVVFRWGGRFGSVPAPRLALAWLATIAVTALWHARTLETLSIAAHPLVLEPGWGFRVVASVTLAAGGAVAWWLADRVDRTEVADGVLVIGGAMVAGDVLATVWGAGAAAAGAGDGVGAAAIPVACAGALVTAAAWGPRWPVGWLRSPIDVALAPILAAGLTPAIRLPAAAGPASVLAGLAAVAVVVRAERGRPSPVGCLAVLPLAVGAGAVALGLLSVPGALDRLVVGGPFDGDVDAELVLTAPDAGSDDASVLAARLAALGVDHELTGSGGRVELVLRDVVGVNEVLDAVLPRRAIELREVVEEGEDRADAVLRQQCDSDGTGCEDLWLRPPELGAADIATASVFFSELGEPLVAIEFTPEGARRFGAFTTRLVRRRFAIVLDDRVILAPQVMEPILGGAAKVWMGNWSDDPLRDAHALTVALRTPPLRGTWTLAEQR